MSLVLHDLLIDYWCWKKWSVLTIYHGKRMVITWIAKEQTILRHCIWRFKNNSKQESKTKSVRVILLGIRCKKYLYMKSWFQSQSLSFHPFLKNNSIPFCSITNYSNLFPRFKYLFTGDFKLKTNKLFKVLISSWDINMIQIFLFYFMFLKQDSFWF